ncbi:hypothetical protein VTI74DRAFT_6645 [Chaetomium olivicolor]
MSADSLPITPARFAAALPDLPLSSLHLKLLELRNSIAHLDYSNEQLRPYAEGTATATSSQPPPQQHHAEGQTQERPRGEPDQDCIDAIRENEEVIARMQERIRLVREEVERRGLSWTEFQGRTQTDETNKGEEEGGEGAGSTAVNGDTRPTVNGTATTGEASGAGRHSAWRDGTFQTGVIRGGELHMDAVAGSRQGQQGQGQGGSLSDEELRRRVEEQLRNLGTGDDDEDDGGLHL